MDTLADPVLKMAAETVDDLERVRIANENRLRQLTRSEADSDGEERGFGLTIDHPSVKAQAAIVEGMAALEHQAVLALQRLMRRHPLGPWMKAQPGIGEKQGARLLAALGDPYIRPDMVRADGTVEPSRPRTVSELWAYAGMHVVDLRRTDDQRSNVGDDPLDLPVDHSCLDAQWLDVGGYLSGGDPDRGTHDTQVVPVGVAAHRRRGQRSNWNADARMRVYLIAASCVKQPDGSRWRDVYTAAREKYADATHRAPCPRCGPAGKPALSGSPLSLGHQHARAVRIVAKTILKELWRESGRLHGDDRSPPVSTITASTPTGITSGRTTLDSPPTRGEATPKPSSSTGSHTSSPGGRRSIDTQRATAAGG